jgi:hypothetical protein
MSVRITFTDDVFPPSREFMDFVEKWISNDPFDGTSWAEFGLERVEMIGQRPSTSTILEKAERLIKNEEGKRYISRSYELFAALLVGDLVALQSLQEKFSFILVVGIPRSGGKYITKQLFRALGYDPKRVPEVLGHDGFPDAGPWRFGDSGNGWISSLHTMAEYLTMVEIFFSHASVSGGRIVVPKKAMKAVYAAGLFRTALGASTERIITIRHPVPCCISTYDAAGGFPRDGCFALRGNIEKFCARDLVDLGLDRKEIERMDYFSAYLRYWENYQTRLATSGFNTARKCRILAFGADRYMYEARQFAERFGAANVQIEPFHAKSQQSSHSDWMEMAEHSLRRVYGHWERAGLEFPLKEINAAW